ncbi:P-type conjugative transfer protein TrbJ [Thiothrix winogradskyi]|uniref:P-type conjugative transfer protein TrbJ n=1 Tax=Thiothrix winogradskyi TaxID=96472 RepID=A0ABY3SX73_9GAMM|nr:P-type conjugative transfer protein TrbJ [Thiothrix winogradskyi]UJS23532.1 P-type conjugative transfer protein TrbJ [Thiothrix winogradskyi]
MNTSKILPIYFSVALSLSALPLHSYAAGGGVSALTGAKEWTQLANNAELIAIYGQEAKNLLESIKQTETMLTNLKTLPDFAKTGLKADVMKLQAIVQAGNALSYAAANIEGDFNTAFKGAFGYDAPMTRQEWVDQHQSLTMTTQDTVLASLKAANLQNSMFDSEAALLEGLEGQLSSAEGTNEILQAAGGIAAQQVASLNKMRQLTASNMQMQAAKIAADEDRQAAALAEEERFKGRTGAGNKITVDPNNAERVVPTFQFK